MSQHTHPAIVPVASQLLQHKQRLYCMVLELSLGQPGLSYYITPTDLDCMTLSDAGNSYGYRCGDMLVSHCGQSSHTVYTIPSSVHGLRLNPPADALVAQAHSQGPVRPCTGLKNATLPPLKTCEHCPDLLAFGSLSLLV